jgi:hypothetical protein
VHPRCAHVLEELRLCSFKVDRLSGDVLPDLKPGMDHLVDALRYALQPMIKGTGPEAFLAFMAKQAGTTTNDAKEASGKRPGAVATDLVFPWHQE